MRQLIYVMLMTIFFNTTIFAAEKPAVYTEDKLGVTVTAEQPQFIIKLKSNPTTGYSWFLRKYDEKLLKPVKQNFIPGDKKLIGAPGYQEWIFTVKQDAFVVPQQTIIHFVYARPWAPKEQANELIFKVSTFAKHN